MARDSFYLIYMSSRCKTLVLDAGPLLSLSPLRGLAETYVTVPQVLAELKDVRARQHFEQLGLISGVNIRIQSPDASSLAHGVFFILFFLFRLPITDVRKVIQWAKKTGDYSVLSHVDLCILALTYALHEQGKREDEKNGDEASPRQVYNILMPNLTLIVDGEHKRCRG